MPTLKVLRRSRAGRKLVNLHGEVYTVSNQGAFTKDFCLRDQIRRASVSIMSNIAEGFEKRWEPGISRRCKGLEWRSKSATLCFF